MSPWSCGQLADVAEELALDALPGDLRALALEHLEGCCPCRASVESLAETADELLTATTPVEPPAWFADRVLANLTAGRDPRRRRFRKPLTLVAVAAVVLAVSGGVATLARLRTQSPGEGSELRTVQLVSTTGQVVGDASRYAGHPAWVFMRVDRGVSAGAETCVLDLTGGATLPIGTLTVSGGKGAWGEHLPIDGRRIGSVRLVTLGGTTVATAEFGAR
jgi:hypothetical protein